MRTRTLVLLSFVLLGSQLLTTEAEGGWRAQQRRAARQAWRQQQGGGGFQRGGCGNGGGCGTGGCFNNQCGNMGGGPGTGCNCGGNCPCGNQGMQPGTPNAQQTQSIPGNQQSAGAVASPVDPNRGIAAPTPNNTPTNSTASHSSVDAVASNDAGDTVVTRRRRTPATPISSSRDGDDSTGRPILEYGDDSKTSQSLYRSPKGDKFYFKNPEGGFLEVNMVEGDEKTGASPFISLKKNGKPPTWQGASADQIKHLVDYLNFITKEKSEEQLQMVYKVFGGKDNVEAWLNKWNAIAKYSNPDLLKDVQKWKAELKALEALKLEEKRAELEKTTEYASVIGQIQKMQQLKKQIAKANALAVDDVARDSNYIGPDIAPAGHVANFLDAYRDGAKGLQRQASITQKLEEQAKVAKLALAGAQTDEQQKDARSFERKASRDAAEARRTLNRLREVPEKVALLSKWALEAEHKHVAEKYSPDQPYVPSKPSSTPAAIREAAYTPEPARQGEVDEAGRKAGASAYKYIHYGYQPGANSKVNESSTKSMWHTLVTTDEQNAMKAGLVKNLGLKNKWEEIDLSLDRVTDKQTLFNYHVKGAPESETVQVILQPNGDFTLLNGKGPNLAQNGMELTPQEIEKLKRSVALQAKLSAGPEKLTIQHEPGRLGDDDLVNVWLPGKDPAKDKPDHQGRIDLDGKFKLEIFPTAPGEALPPVTEEERAALARIPEDRKKILRKGHFKFVPGAGGYLNCEGGCKKIPLGNVVVDDKTDKQEADKKWLKAQETIAQKNGAKSQKPSETSSSSAETPRTPVAGEAITPQFKTSSHTPKALYQTIAAQGTRDDKVNAWNRWVNAPSSDKIGLNKHLADGLGIDIKPEDLISQFDEKASDKETLAFKIWNRKDYKNHSNPSYTAKMDAAGNVKGGRYVAPRVTRKPPTRQWTQVSSGWDCPGCLVEMKANGISVEYNPATRRNELRTNGDWEVKTVAITTADGQRVTGWVMKSREKALEICVKPNWSKTVDDARFNSDNGSYPGHREVSQTEDQQANN